MKEIKETINLLHNIYQSYPDEDTANKLKEYIKFYLDAITSEMVTVAEVNNTYDLKIPKNNLSVLGKKVKEAYISETQELPPVRMKLLEQGFRKPVYVYPPWFVDTIIEFAKEYQKTLG